MNFSYFITIAITTVYFTVDCQDYSDTDPEGRLTRFHNSRPTGSRECQVSNRLGVCKRRSRCRNPTNRICRSGFIPIVCCMDDSILIEPPKPVQTSPRPVRTSPRPVRTSPRPVRTSPRTVRTTPKQVRTTPKSVRVTTHKVEGINEVDIVFPGCGSKTPSVGSKTTVPPRREMGRRGGIFGNFERRRGKRSAEGIASLGRSRRAMQPVIVGGEIAKPNSWPWMVAVFKKSGSSSRFLCGASLISKNFILTAAHCFNPNEVKDPSKFSIAVGGHTTTDGTRYDVESIKVHPNYKSGQYYYDMCLLKVRKEVALGRKVYPVCLPSESLRSRIGNANKNITVTGWGDTSFGGVSSKMLQEVELPVVPLHQCNESYYKTARSTFPEGINQLFICAGVKDGGKDSCQGDSGGPLTMQMEGGDYVQLGVVSFGMGCAQPGFPGVYTRVSKLTKWIKDNTDLGKH